MSIFVIDRFLDFGIRGRFVVFVILAEGFVVGNGGVEGFACCERGFEFGALFCGFGLAESERTAVEVVSSLAGLSSLRRKSVVL